MNEQSEEVFTSELPLQATGTDGAASGAALRQMANERLAAHRHRRAAVEAEQAAAEAAAQERTRTSRSASRAVREAVAQRYQKTVSYHDFLTIEAERALAQAQAEIEVATRKAQAVAEAQLKLLGEIEQWRETQPGPRAVAIDAARREHRHSLAEAVAAIAETVTEMFEPAPAEDMQPRIAFGSEPEPQAQPVQPATLTAPPTAAQRAAGFTVRLYEELSAGIPGARQTRNTLGGQAADRQATACEAAALDEEIAFRRAPAFEDFRVAPEVIPGNLIEFPKPLVAARKVRPRRAEGPLLEDTAGAPQLRIFEVDPELVSTTPEATEPLGLEWQALILPAQAEADLSLPLDAQMQLTTVPQVASVELRLMSIAVDSSILGAALLGFAATAARLAGPAIHLLPRVQVLGTLGITAAVMMVVYRLLFYTFSDATPGMRYARIAFCTFGEAHPARRDLRRRVIASVLAACPLALGFAWVLMDDERLGWHDRISRMYPRAY
jgi:hypothetical protein